MKTIILVGGEGKKMWPFSVVRNKTMIPISNKPIIRHIVDNLIKLGVDDISIVGSYLMEEIEHELRNYKVNILKTAPNLGNVDSLLSSGLNEDFMFVFGDTFIHINDLERLVNSSLDTLLISDSGEDSRNHIVAKYTDTHFLGFLGHPRNESSPAFLLGGLMSNRFAATLKHNKARFTQTKVGVGSPREKYLEESINDYLIESKVDFIKTKNKAIDIDKPWHVLEANDISNSNITGGLGKSEIAVSAKIDDSAQIIGNIVIGSNSIIGKNVVINGNVIIGENSLVDNGAIIGNGVVIGDNTIVRNYCKIGDYSSIGNNCIVEFTAEFSGILMDKNTVYHHSLFSGICGERCDIGAGTISGGLRFDDGKTTQVVNGRKEIPTMYANETYLGDYSRTGLNVMFQPGVKIGANSIIGSGVIVNEDLPNNTLIYTKQETVVKELKEDRYGW